MSALIRAHLKHLRAGGCSDNTLRDRRRLLVAADLALPYGLGEATTEELETFLARPGRARWTLCTYYWHVMGFYTWATGGEDPWLDYNPAAHLARPRAPGGTPDPVTDAEVGQSLANSDARWQLAISLAAYAGLRVGDITGLRREDVNASTILVRHGKGDKTVHLPTHAEIWRRVEPMPPGRLVRSSIGAPYTPSHLSSVARDHFDRLGMPEVHLHRFRHWYACALLRGGADIRTVQSLMRHASLETTARYLEIVNEQREIAIATLLVPATAQQTAA